MTDGLERKLLVLVKWLIIQQTFGHCFADYFFWTGFLHGLFAVFQSYVVKHQVIILFVLLPWTLQVHLVELCPCAVLMLNMVRSMAAACFGCASPGHTTMFSAALSTELIGKSPDVRLILFS